MKLTFILILLSFVPKIGLAQLNWINYFNNDSTNIYFYNRNGISKNGNSILTTRSIFSQNNGTYFSNFQIINVNGIVIKDTTYNPGQFSGISNVENAPIGNGFVIAQIYNPQTTFSSDVYQYLSDSGSTTTISSDDSIGKVLDIKSRNDTLFSLTEDYILKIKLFDSLGNLIGNIPLDTTTALVRFSAESFEFGPTGIIVFGQKTFSIGTFDSHYCIRYVDWQGNLIFEYLNNRTTNPDVISSLTIIPNNIVFSGKQDMINGVNGIDIGILNMNGILQWDTTIVYQTPQRGITDLKSTNGHVYYGLIGWKSLNNSYSVQVQCLNTATKIIQDIIEIDSLRYRSDIKLTNFNSNIIACVTLNNNLTSIYKLLQFTPNNYIQFFSFIDTTFSPLTYLLIDNNNLFFGSSSFLAKYDISSLSIKGENSFINFSVFPNPASTTLTIKLNSEIYGLRYKLTTISGEIVQSSDYLSDRINVEKLPNGLYFLQLYNDFYSVTRKILIFH